MKKMYKPFIKGMNWGIIRLLSLLGFADCTCENATEEYGVPHTSFSAKNNAREENREYDGNDLNVESVI